MKKIRIFRLQESAATAPLRFWEGSICNEESMIEWVEWVLDSTRREVKIEKKEKSKRENFYLP